jgi:hypothetical protein
MADNFNHFAEIANALPKLTSQMVRKTALDAKGNVQAHIVANGQVDTSFMLNSVYTVTSEGSDYKGGERALPQVAAPADDQTAYVAVAAEYAIFPNYGTVHQVGKPFFEPGIEEARESLDAALKVVADKLGDLA